MLKTTPWGPVYDDFCILQKVRNSFFRSAAPVGGLIVPSLEVKIGIKIIVFNFERYQVIITLSPSCSASNFAPGNTLE